MATHQANLQARQVREGSVFLDDDGDLNFVVSVETLRSWAEEFETADDSKLVSLFMSDSHNRLQTIYHPESRSTEQGAVVPVAGDTITFTVSQP